MHLMKNKHQTVELPDSSPRSGAAIAPGSAFTTIGMVSDSDGVNGLIGVDSVRRMTAGVFGDPKGGACNRAWGVARAGTDTAGVARACKACALSSDCLSCHSFNIRD